MRNKQPISSSIFFTTKKKREDIEPETTINRSVLKVINYIVFFVGKNIAIFFKRYAMWTIKKFKIS